MKRTTYIMIGMLVTGVAMVCGLMFYVVDRNVTQKDNFMEIGGERKTVQLPSCRVLKLTQPPVVWKQKKEGIVEAERMFSFGEVPLEVTAGDSLQQGSFSYAGDMEAFMSMTSVGDTLFVTFDFPEDKLEQHLQNDIWIRAESWRSLVISARRSHISSRSAAQARHTTIFTGSTMLRCSV